MKRLPIVLSATALVIAVFGSTPVGHAVASKVPAFAKKAGYADRAGTAATLSGIKVSKQARPGMLVPLGADGKFPASVGIAGLAGSQGPKGEKGEQGPAGPKGATGATGAVGATGPRGLTGASGIGGYQILTSSGLSVPANTTRRMTVQCPSGKKTLSGGVSKSSGGVVAETAPLDGGTGWTGLVYNLSSTPTTMYVWALCANVS